MTDKEKFVDLLKDLKNLKRIEVYSNMDCNTYEKLSEDGSFVYWDSIEDIIKKYEEK